MKLRAVLILVFLCAPYGSTVWAENDGNFWRAEETSVIGPVLDGYQLADGIAAGPTGTAYNGNIYLAVHTSFWPRWNRGLPLCPSVNQSEVVSVWKIPATSAGIYQKAALVGQLSPCEGFLGSGYWGIDGTLAVGGNGKFYATMNRTRCDDWPAGCFDNEYLGANTSLDNTSYHWQYAPILAASTVTFDGQSRSLNWQGFIALNSFTANPAPPASLFPRINSSIGPATLWGYVHWGFKDNDVPSHLARVQIVETATTLAPNWQTTKVFVYANDGTWRQAATNGVVNFVPYDAAGFNNPPGDFNNRVIASLYFDSATRVWLGVGHNVGPNGLAIGCDERAANWFTSPSSPWYQGAWAGTDNSTVELTQMGSSTTTNLRYDTYTQNTVQLGASVFEVGSGSTRTRYLFRGSTEKICRYQPASWWHPWIGSEITVESIQ